jgi:transcriptional regulator with XRE-family HTH domain
MADAEPGGENHFGAELKSQRTYRGWTQEQLGDKLGYSGSFVSDVERGNRMARLDFAKHCDEVFESPGTFVRWHEASKRDAYPSFFAPVIDFETTAVRIQGWELGAIPGLLQTEAYARALIMATRPHDNADAVQRLVMGRMERQEILHGDNPPKLWYVLDESVVRRIVGSVAVMAEQLDQLIACARMSGIVLQVLPFTAGDHAGTDGPVTVYDFNDHATVVYAECNRGGRIVEDSPEVAELLTVVNMVRASALSPRATLDLLTKVRSELDE